MTKIEIIILIVVIFVSVTLLSLFLNKVLKDKTTKKEKKEKKPQAVKEEKPEVIKEEKKEPIIEKEKGIKESKKKEKTPEISLALKNELDEFKDYLKTRITPEMVTEEEKIRHPYDMPKINRFNSFRDSDFPDLDDFPYMKKENKRNKYEDLPDEVKILLFTNFFDTKF